MPKSINPGKVASFVLHGLFVCARVYPWGARQVKPASVRAGVHGGSGVELIYFSRQGSSLVQLQPHKRLTLPARKKQRRARHLPAPEPQPTMARAGSPTGSALTGPVDGDEVVPAIPLVYPDPALSREEKSALTGDVVVEVTIDPQGRVVGAQLVQSLAAHVDATVMAAVETWQFRPASFNGVPIASKQDVHFHFPS